MVKSKRLALISSYMDTNIDIWVSYYFILISVTSYTSAKSYHAKHISRIGMTQLLDFQKKAFQEKHQKII